MALREFRDDRRRRWTVWAVYPTLAERRHTDVGPPPRTPERRRHKESRAHLDSRLARGWLAFECEDGERRRLAPIPDTAEGWQMATDEELLAWCARAQQAPRAKRLIE